MTMKQANAKMVKRKKQGDAGLSKAKVKKLVTLPWPCCQPKNWLGA